jgi:phosphorylcholine metabolism protein LicD
MPILTTEYLNGLIELFKNVVLFLDEKEIKYWLCSGSLLGAVRNKGQIKHDDDGDLAMFEPDLIKFIECCKELAERHSYLITAHGGMIKVANQRIYRMSEEIEDARLAATIDIAMYHKEDDKIIIALPQHQELWSECYHYEKDFEPLKKIQYEDIEVWSVSNPEPYLERFYGLDWRVEKDIKSETHTN